MTACTGIWHGRRLDANDPMHRSWVEPNRPEIVELCRRHGLDACLVVWVEFDLIDLPLLRFGLYDREDDGRMRRADGHERGDGCDACPLAIHTEERALIGALPDWWQPGINHERNEVSDR